MRGKSCEKSKGTPGAKSLGGRCERVNSLFLFFQSVVNPVIIGNIIYDILKLNQKGYKSWEI